MEQGSEEWLAWRKKGLGGSDIPCLFWAEKGIELLEYSTPIKLWKEKTKDEKEEKDQFTKAIFQAGHENEAKIRAAYEFEKGNSFPPLEFEDPDHPELRVSLDGFCEELWAGCEIKLVKKDHFENSNVKLAHWIQMQYQMMLTKCKEWDYVISNDQINYKIINIKADPEFQSFMKAKVLNFWGLVKTKTMPEYTDMDFRPMESEELKGLLECIKDHKDSKDKNDKKQVEFWRLSVFDLVKYPRVEAYGARITKTEKTKMIKFLGDKNEEK